MTLQLLAHAENASIHVATLVAYMTRWQCVSPRSEQALKAEISRSFMPVALYTIFPVDH